MCFECKKYLCALRCSTKEEAACDGQRATCCKLPWAFEPPETACPGHWTSTSHCCGDECYLWPGVCAWALRSDKPLGRVLKGGSRGKATLAVVLRLASACIASSVLERTMIFWAVRSTFCTILYFLIIATKLFIEKYRLAVEN